MEGSELPDLLQLVAITLYILSKWKINYRLILMDGDTFVPKHQRFFTTASILSAIYLILFAIYLLAELKIIASSILTQLGYLMWIINIIFLLAPLRIFNYEGRRYFLRMLWRTTCSLSSNGYEDTLLSEHSRELYPTLQRFRFYCLPGCQS
jgi:hypothetical protein